MNRILTTIIATLMLATPALAGPNCDSEDGIHQCETQNGTVISYDANEDSVTIIAIDGNSYEKGPYLDSQLQEELSETYPEIDEYLVNAINLHVFRSEFLTNPYTFNNPDDYNLENISNLFDLIQANGWKWAYGSGYGYQISSNIYVEIGQFINVEEEEIDPYTATRIDITMYLILHDRTIDWHAIADFDRLFDN